jgi:DnaJ-domain-containing protein 1
MVITVHDTPPYGHAPTYQISLTYHERQKSYGPDKLRWEEAEEAEEAEAMTIRWCVAYRNDLRGTLTFDLKVK